MKVLLVEDSERLQRAVATGLRRAGGVVDLAGDGADALWRLQGADYDVVVLDLMLPKVDGWTVLQRLRATGSTVPVLLLTARDALADRVKGLNSGADDYLVKPFAFEELLARVQALARRGHGVRRPAVAIGPLAVDLVARQASVGGAPVDFTAREFQLVEFLALRPGQLVTREQIESRLWDEAADPSSNVVDALVCRVRRKLAAHSVGDLLHTRRGLGYVLGERVAS